MTAAATEGASPTGATHRDESDALLAGPIGEGTRSSILARHTKPRRPTPRGFVAFFGLRQLPFQAVNGAGFAYGGPTSIVTSRCCVSSIARGLPA